MSAPLRLTAKDLDDLSDFLALLSAASRQTGVSVTAYGPITVSLGDNFGIQVAWQPEAADATIDVRDRLHGEYVIDDQVGS